MKMEDNNKITKKMTIAIVAKASGVGIEAIRFYERKKLIDQPKAVLKIRYYSQDHVEKIRFIKKAQRVGFTLAEIKSLLMMKVDPTKDCAPIKKKTHEKIHEVVEKIEDLQKILKALKKLEDACSGHEPTESCSILDGLKGLEL